MSVWDHIHVDQEAAFEAAVVIEEVADIDTIPALDAAAWDWCNDPVVLRADASVLDGNHRVIGIHKWMQTHNYDSEDFLEIPALRVSREEESTHPIGETTPSEWVQQMLGLVGRE